MSKARNIMAGFEQVTKGARAGSLSRDVPTQEVPFSRLVRREPFASLFEIAPETLAAIKKDMKLKGFDKSKPVNVWKEPDGEGGYQYTLVDGFTRARAMQELGRPSVTAYVNQFADEREALDYALHQQRDRRNLSPATILNVVKALYKPGPRGRPEKGSAGPFSGPKGKASERAAAAISLPGVTPSTVKRSAAVLRHPDLEKDVRTRKRTLSAAANEARRRDAAKKSGSSAQRLPAASLTLKITQLRYLLAHVRGIKNPTPDQQDLRARLQKALKRA